MIEELNKILEEKGITHSEVKKGIIAYFVKHDQLFGDIIPTEGLIERLKNNLDKVELVDTISDSRKSANALGIYYGFDEKKIELAFNDEYLKNKQLYEDFMDLLFHELTHCLYREKDKVMPWKEKHIFASYELLADDIVVSGEFHYTEPIVNYISSILRGKINSSYVAQTHAMRRIANIIGVKEIVKSAYDFDLDHFKSLFDTDLINGTYEDFTTGLSLVGTTFYSLGKRIIDNMLEGEYKSSPKSI